MKHKTPILVALFALPISALVVYAVVVRAAEPPPTPRAPRVAADVSFQATAVPDHVPQRYWDGLHAYLFDLLDGLQPARDDEVCEKVHRTDHCERSDLHALRLSKIVTEIEEAVRLDESILLDDEWKYAATLVWIGWRESLFARNPRLIGTEDLGHAHGPWQIQPLKTLGETDENVHRATTALARLTTPKVGAQGRWGLPTNEPWRGYGPAERWVRNHPYRP